MSRRLLWSFLLALVAVVSVAGRAPQAPPLADLKTTAEASGFKSTSTYDDVIKFVNAVVAAAPSMMHLTSMGKTAEGRTMPLVVVSPELKDATPAAVRDSGKLRVYIQGNIHAGEVEGKESAQMLLREFAQGKHSDWLQSTVFLINPIYNADGNERFALNNRGVQNGPINGMGIRANSQGYDLNRDHMKLDSPEANGLIKMMVDYDPHVGIDLHTTDGSCMAYMLTYAPPLNPNTSDKIMSVMTKDWFPYITRNVKSKYKMDMFYYGNVEGGDSGCGDTPGEGRMAAPPTVGAAATTGTPAPTGTGRGRGAQGQAAQGQTAQTPAAQPAQAGQTSQGQGQTAPAPAGQGQTAPARGGQTAAPAGGRGQAAAGGATQPGRGQGGGRGGGRGGGLPALDGPAWATFEHVPRFNNNYIGLRNRFALLSEAYAYATFEDRIKATNAFLEQALTFAHENADKLKKATEDADNDSIVGRLQATSSRIKTGDQIEILMGAVVAEKNPVNDATIRTRLDVTIPVKMYDRLWFEPVNTELGGAEYFIPDTLTKALDLLRRHGVQLRQLTQTARGLEQFNIESNTNYQNFQSHNMRRLTGSWVATDPTMTLPPGTWVVRMNQPLARLAFYLLEPMSDDGLVNWNVLDDQLGADVKVYPILRRR